MVIRRERITGVLHITSHHLIFSSSAFFREIWIGYPMIQKVEKKARFYKRMTSLDIYGRDFTFVTFNVENDWDAQVIYEMIQKYTYMGSLILLKRIHKLIIFRVYLWFLCIFLSSRTFRSYV